MLKWLLAAITILFYRRALPHPEEREDPLNCDPWEAFSKWLTGWDVPEEYWSGWRKYQLILKSSLNSPAETADDIIYIKPGWCNPGVLAHELAHISWCRMHDAQQSMFRDDWKTVKDPMLSLLMKQRNLPANLWGDPDIEMHAEIYRYLGQQMPSGLKIYYPYLLRR